MAAMGVGRVGALAVLLGAGVALGVGVAATASAASDEAAAASVQTSSAGATDSRAGAVSASARRAGKPSTAARPAATAVTPRPSAGSATPQASAPAPAPRDSVLIRASDLMAKPTSGAGWDFLKKQADSSWGTPDLLALNSSTQTKVLAAALVYARTGDVAYRDKVIAAVSKAPGTELKSGTTKPVVLPFARNVFGYVVAADLVDMPLSTVTANGKTWEEFLRGARERVFPGNTRWPNLEITSGDSASNWNAYALSSHLAISLVLDDEAAVQRDITIYRRFLGDVTSPWPAFKPTSGYTWAGNLLTGSSPGRGWDLTPTLQRGINPAVPGNPRSGAIILDALRNSSVPAGPCCKLDLAGRAYTEESLDALLAINMMLRAQGTDFTNFEDQALRRAYEFLQRNGGPSGYSNGRYLALAINTMYGTKYSTAAGDSVGRHLGFGGWLF